MSRFTFVILLFLLSSLSAQSDTLVLTLQQVVEQARVNSPAARIAQTTFNNRYWQYRSFKSNYRPQMHLTGVLPNLDRSIATITQDDGRDIFIRRSLATSTLDLSLSQTIAPTGGEIFVSSQLGRIDVFTHPRSVNYMANPAVVGIRQPIFGFNDLKWDLRIEPLRYEEAKKQFNEDMETVSLQAVELFFRLLQAQNTVRIHALNVLNNDTLYQISVGRYNLGKIAENDLLQMELNLMRARNDRAQAEMDQDIAATRLLNFLKLPAGTPVRLVEPVETPLLVIDEQFALQQARQNRADIIELERMIIESEKMLQEARAGSRVSADIFATYGLTQASPDFTGAYVDPLDQQRVRVGLAVPILTWGRNKAQVQTALANRELAQANTEQAREIFELEVQLLVRQLSGYRDKLLLATRADTIAQRSFDLTMNRYLIGKVGILDLNQAMREKDIAKASYLSSLEMYWSIYFELRRKTLYDFMLNQPVSYLRN